MKLKAAADAAGKPAYLEMSSLNPVLILPGALADRITELLRDESTRARMGRAARERMRGEFSFEAQASAYVRLFKSLRPTRATVAV